MDTLSYQHSSLGADHDEQEALVASIRERGVIQAVVVDEDGAIIDGHHRAMIADSLGIEYPKQVITGLSPEEKRVLAVSLNVDRRHLTDAQKARLGQKIEPDIAAIARSKMADGGTKGAPGKGRSNDQTFRTPERDLTRSVVASKVGIGSGITYERHKQIIEQAQREAPDLMPPELLSWHQRAAPAYTRG